MTFRDWMIELDEAVSRQCGLSIHDLADQPFRDAFEAGEDPEDFAIDALADNGFDV